MSMITWTSETECPSCYQRGHHSDDCVCCGGKGRVNVEWIESIIEETLYDLMRGVTTYDRQQWLVPGVYFIEPSDSWWQLTAEGAAFRLSESEAWKLINPPRIRPVFAFLSKCFFPIRALAMRAS
jgi:hypothetical protein